MTEAQSVEHALRLRAVEGRMTVAEKAATIAALLRFARQIDTRDEHIGNATPDLCASCVSRLLVTAKSAC